MEFATSFSVCNSPDRTVSVLRNQECAVACDRHSSGPSPHLGVVDDKASEKIFVFAGWRPVFQKNSDYFIAGTFGSIPGSMFSGESIRVIFRGKHIAVVKRHPKRSGMGLDENIGNDDVP